MDIPNLSNQTPVSSSASSKISLPVIFIVVAVALALGFWISRLSGSIVSNGSSSASASSKDLITSTDQISSASQLQVGKLYGSLDARFSDGATGVIQAGGVNGEGTDTLVRDGGPSQNVALTSSEVDLSLFVGKKVSVKGETNASTKAAWLLDVGNIQIVQ